MASSILPMATPCVREGEYILVQKITKERPTKLVQALSANKMKFGSLTFRLADFIGQPYGSFFTVTNGQAKRSATINSALLLADSDQVTGDNREIHDNTATQSLTRDEIEALKQKGVQGEDIISKLINNSESFQSRTEFSKAKYTQRKQEKYMTMVTVLPVTPRRLCELMMQKGKLKIMSLRVDTLAQLLTYASVAPGGRILVADTIQGLLAGSVLARLGGMGECMHLHVGDFPSSQLIDACNFSPDVLSAWKSFPLDLVPVAADLAKQCNDLKPEDGGEEGDSVSLKAQRAASRREAAQSIATGNFDSLVVVCRFNPQPILQSLLPLLGLSRPFALYSQYKEPLIECFGLAKAMGCVRVDLSETWTREYQILPFRSHPINSMSATGGYLLTGIRAESGPCGVEKKGLKRTRER